MDNSLQAFSSSSSLNVMGNESPNPQHATILPLSPHVSQTSALTTNNSVITAVEHVKRSVKERSALPTDFIYVAQPASKRDREETGSILATQQQCELPVYAAQALVAEAPWLTPQNDHNYNRMADVATHGPTQGFLAPPKDIIQSSTLVADGDWVEDLCIAHNHRPPADEQSSSCLGRRVEQLQLYTCSFKLSDRCDIEDSPLTPAIRSVPTSQRDQEQSPNVLPSRNVAYDQAALVDVASVSPQEEGHPINANCEKQGVISTNVVSANMLDYAAKSVNKCLFVFIDAYRLLVESEKAVLDAYWCTTATNSGNTEGGMNAGGTIDATPPVQCIPLDVGIMGLDTAAVTLSAEEAALLAPWMEPPTNFKRIRPEPRYHRHLSSQDRALHHVLFHTHLAKSGTLPPAFQALTAISNRLKAYGSLLVKGSHTSKGGIVSPHIGHVWITLPILSSMRHEITTLVECSQNKKGPLYAAIEALHESMLTPNRTIAARIVVSIIDYEHLQKLDPKGYVTLPSRATDYERDAFIRISCKSGRHCNKRVAQEAAAFAVYRLATEIVLEGMVEAALDKPLVAPLNATEAQRFAADDLQRDERMRYFEVVDISEKNYEAANILWQSAARKKKLDGDKEFFQKSLKRASETVAEMRERREVDALFNRQKYSQLHASHNNAGRGTLVAEAKLLQAQYPGMRYLCGVQHHQPSHQTTVHEQPPTSFGRRVEQHLPLVLPPGSMARCDPSVSTTYQQPPTPHKRPQPQIPQPTSIELGNNYCDFNLPENGLVSPRHCLKAFDQIAGLNATQRNALIVSLHARMMSTIALWPKSMEQLRSADTFQLLRTVVETLGGYGRVDFEVLIKSADEEEELFLPSFACAAPTPPVAKYRATISVILIAPANVLTYGPPQHSLLMDMLRQGQGVDKTRVQSPMLHLLSGSGTESVGDMNTAMKLASVAMIDAITPVLMGMRTYFRQNGTAAL